MKRIKKTEGWCSAVALKYVSGLPEKTVMAVLEHEGFDPSHGAEDSEWLAAAKTLGIKLKSVRIEPQRLRKFIRKRVGLFFVCTHDHIFVVREGLVYDPMFGSGRLDCVVRWAWRVIE